MAIKRLRSGKTIESAKVSKLSETAKKHIAEAVMKQNISLMEIEENTKDSAEKIKTAGYYILRTSHDMNEYFSAVAGNYKLSPIKIEIGELISGFCETLRPFAIKRGFGITYNSCKDKVFIRADLKKLCYVLANLVLNATENSPKGERIRISVSATRRFAKIIVGDRGYGMDEETLLSCCEPFFSKKEDSMGLGLTLARHFAAESGGRMNISSKPGKGTTVSLLLPVEEGEQTDLCVGSPAADIMARNTEILNMVFAEI